MFAIRALVALRAAPAMLVDKGTGGLAGCAVAALGLLVDAPGPAGCPVGFSHRPWGDVGLMAKKVRRTLIAAMALITFN